jgi:hypothetical protein
MGIHTRSLLAEAATRIKKTIANQAGEWGDGRLSICALANAFESAVYGYVTAIGTRGQLLLLADSDELLSARTDWTGNAPDDVAGTVKACVCAALSEHLKPKLVEMGFKLHEGRLVELLDEASRLLGQTAAGLALGSEIAAEGRLPDDFAARLSELRETAAALASRPRDKEMLRFLGTTAERVVRLSDSVSDVIELHSLDPARLEAAILAEATPVAAPRFA